MQLIDELAMIYTVLISLFATFSYDRSPWLQWSIFVGLTTIGFTITSVYHYLHEPLFHQNAFALLMITLLGNGFYKMETIVKYSNPKARILLWQIVGWGSVIFLSAFALWNLDNAYCTQLRRIRRNIGMPWGFFLGIKTTPTPLLSSFFLPQDQYQSPNHANHITSQFTRITRNMAYWYRSRRLLSCSMGRALENML